MYKWIKQGSFLPCTKVGWHYVSPKLSCLKYVALVPLSPREEPFPFQTTHLTQLPRQQLSNPECKMTQAAAADLVQAQEEAAVAATAPPAAVLGNPPHSTVPGNYRWVSLRFPLCWYSTEPQMPGKRNKLTAFSNISCGATPNICAIWKKKKKKKTQKSECQSTHNFTAQFRQDSAWCLINKMTDKWHLSLRCVSSCPPHPLQLAVWCIDISL